MKTNTRLLKELRKKYMANGMTILEANARAESRISFLKDVAKTKFNTRPRRDLTV